MDEGEIDNLLSKNYDHEARENSPPANADAINVTARALVSALLGLLISGCALTTGSTEVPLNEDEFTHKVQGVSSARRFTKPAIHLMLGYGVLSTIATALSSLLLLLAVMAKSWSMKLAWLAVPAVLLLAAELVSDASDALVATSIMAMSDPGPTRAFLHAIAATIMIASEAIIWYFIAKFFEYSYMDNGSGEVLNVHLQPRMSAANTSN